MDQGDEPVIRTATWLKAWDSHAFLPLTPSGPVAGASNSGTPSIRSPLYKPRGRQPVVSSTDDRWPHAVAPSAIGRIAAGTAAMVVTLTRVDTSLATHNPHLSAQRVVVVESPAEPAHDDRVCFRARAAELAVPRARPSHHGRLARDTDERSKRNIVG